MAYEHDICKSCKKFTIINQYGECGGCAKKNYPERKAKGERK